MRDLLNQRQGLLHKNYRFFFWFFVAGIVLLIIFLLSFLNLVFSHGYTDSLIQSYPLLVMALWVIYLFLLFKNWGYSMIQDMCYRINKEISEVIRGERRIVFFRKSDPWSFDQLSKFTQEAITHVNSIERDYWINKNQLIHALEKGDKQQLLEQLTLIKQKSEKWKAHK